MFGPAIPLNSSGSETLQHNYCIWDGQVTCTVGFLSLIMRLWGSECLKVKIDLSGEYSQQHNTNITRLKVPSVCLTGPRAPYTLTSAMLLPYFRMPLSRKKYLWREQGRQVGEWNNVGIMCNMRAKSEVAAWHHDAVLLMYDVCAFRCVSLQLLVCLRSSGLQISLPPLSPQMWFSYRASPESNGWEHKDLKSSDCKSILNV